MEDKKKLNKIKSKKEIKKNEILKNDAKPEGRKSVNQMKSLIENNIKNEKERKSTIVNKSQLKLNLNNENSENILEKIVSNENEEKNSITERKRGNSILEKLSIFSNNSSKPLVPNDKMTILAKSISSSSFIKKNNKSGSISARLSEGPKFLNGQKNNSQNNKINDTQNKNYNLENYEDDKNTDRIDFTENIKDVINEEDFGKLEIKKRISFYEQRKKCSGTILINKNLKSDIRKYSINDENNNKVSEILKTKIEEDVITQNNSDEYLSLSIKKEELNNSNIVKNDDLDISKVSSKNSIIHINSDIESLNESKNTIINNENNSRNDLNLSINNNNLNNSSVILEENVNVYNEKKDSILENNNDVEINISENKIEEKNNDCNFNYKIEDFKKISDIENDEKEIENIKNQNEYIEFSSANQNIDTTNENRIITKEKVKDNKFHESRLDKNSKEIINSSEPKSQSKNLIYDEIELTSVDNIFNQLKDFKNTKEINEENIKNNNLIINKEIKKQTIHSEISTSSNYEGKTTNDNNCNFKKNIFYSLNKDLKSNKSPNNNNILKYEKLQNEDINGLGYENKNNIGNGTQNSLKLNMKNKMNNNFHLIPDSEKNLKLNYENNYDQIKDISNYNSGELVINVSNLDMGENSFNENNNKILFYDSKYKENDNSSIIDGVSYANVQLKNDINKTDHDIENYNEKDNKNENKVNKNSNRNKYFIGFFILTGIIGFFIFYKK